MGYLASFIERMNNRHDVFFVLTSVHPSNATLARGQFVSSTPERANVPNPKDGGDSARPATVGLTSREETWHFFTTWGPGKPNSWPVSDEGAVSPDHQEKLTLSLYETLSPDAPEISGSIKNPNWKGEISLKLSARDQGPDAVVLHGLDQNGAAVCILLQTS
jgi:hypothetical protein